MSGFGDMKIDPTEGATKGATMGYSADYARGAVASAMESGKDPMGDDADQAICKLTPCLPFQYNAVGDRIKCNNFKPKLCFMDDAYQDFYNAVNFGTLKANAQRYFKGFGVYCWDWFSNHPDDMALFRSVYPSYTYTSAIGEYGMFFKITNLVKPEVDLCGDINYSFEIPVGTDYSTPMRIFHIALHSPKPKLVEIDRSRRDMTPYNCAFFPRSLNPDGTLADTGPDTGSFHYKIDALCSFPPGIGSKKKCSDFILSEEKRPFKEFYYNRDIGFQPNDDPFENIEFAEAALKNPMCNKCTINSTSRETLANILSLHNIIYNLFVDYFNRYMWEVIRLDTDMMDGAMGDRGGGISIKRKSRRTRKSRKTKGSKKPRKSRKTRRLRKTRKLRK
jgi:hypothetical protein